MNTTADSVPAWKKLGLKVKNDSDNTEISVEHLGSAEVTKKQIKRLNQRKRTLDKVTDDAKKPPKRQKLPKDQKRPPPEKDQLAYLRQYHSDRSNWKFSKQKQNWILKNIETIPSLYEKALQVYIEGLQGGSRERVISELQDTLQKWNNHYEKVNASINGEIEEKKVNSPEEKDNTIKDRSTDENGEQIEQAEDKEVPNLSFAKRCATLLHVIGEEITAKGIDILNEDIESSLTTEHLVEDSNEIESSDSSNPSVLLVESVEVNGIGESPRHVKICEKIQKERNSTLNSQVLDDRALSKSKDEVNFDDITESDGLAGAKSGSKGISDEPEKEIDTSENNKREKHIKKRKRNNSSESIDIDKNTSYEINEPNAKLPQADKQELKKDKEHRKDKDQRKKSKKVKKESKKLKKVKKESKKTKEEGKKD